MLAGDMCVWPKMWIVVLYYIIARGYIKSLKGASSHARTIPFFCLLFQSFYTLVYISKQVQYISRLRLQCINLYLAFIQSSPHLPLHLHLHLLLPLPSPLVSIWILKPISIPLLLRSPSISISARTSIPPSPPPPPPRRNVHLNRPVANTPIP